MLYLVNTKIFNMIKNSKWIPSTVTSLESLLNTKLPDISIDLYLTAISQWYEEVYTRQHGLKELIRVIHALLLYYQNVQMYLNENNTNDSTDNDITKQDIKKELNDIITFLKQFDNNFSSSAEDLFAALAKGFSLICKNSFQIDLKRDLTKKEIEIIYLSFLNSMTLMYDLISSIEEKMFHLHQNAWKTRVLSEQKVKEFNTSSQFRINGPQDVIVSFCEDINRYSSSNQKIISASLHNTKSRITFKDRRFGFMYNFNPENIIAMCPDDIQSLNTSTTVYTELLVTIFQGIPIHNLTQRMKLSPIDLKPIYNLDEFKENTILYNEIVLSENAEPFGIFVFRESLNSVKAKVFSLAVANRLPLFVCNVDGSLNFVSYDKILEIMDNSFESIKI